MPHRLYPQVAQRARHRCEYCLAPERIAPGEFEVDHIVPRARGGQDELQNLALACWPCNRHKGQATHAIDTDDDRPGLVRLYNPRRHSWDTHFLLVDTDEGVQVVGQTAVGRATVRRLAMNEPHVVEARLYWALAGWFPP